MKRKQTAVWLSETDKMILQKLADKFDISQSAMMRLLIRQADKKGISLSDLLQKGGGNNDE